MASRETGRGRVFSWRKCSCGFETFVFLSCGWCFSGFSGVKAGSAPCHQIRFTVTLATVFTAHWLPLLPLEAGRCREVGPFEIIALQSAMERDNVLNKGGQAGVGQDCLACESQSPNHSSPLTQTDQHCACSGQDKLASSTSGPACQERALHPLPRVPPQTPS